VGTIVDLVISSGAPADTTPPTLSGMSPASGATNVSTSTTIAATFSEAMNAASISTSTLVLRDASNVAVQGTVGYNATTRVAVLTPALALTSSTTYTATIVGGSGGVKDAAGNPIVGNYAVSFTTAVAPMPPAAISIWPASAAPRSFATSDTSSVELGVKFRSDVAGLVIGVRFYKGTGTTGTHTGTLWSSTGTQLATVTFTNETASGWQQAMFSTPVAIAANTVYVVSYHSNVGRYAYNRNTFAKAGVDAGPLHALKAGVSGGNGGLGYGSGVVFPNSSFNSSNYWVDVVFVPE